MSFEIHLATIKTGSLSFGLKNDWGFFNIWVSWVAGVIWVVMFGLGGLCRLEGLGSL